MALPKASRRNRRCYHVKLCRTCLPPIFQLACGKVDVPLLVTHTGTGIVTVLRNSVFPLALELETGRCFVVVVMCTGIVTVLRAHTIVPKSSVSMTCSMHMALHAMFSSMSFTHVNQRVTLIAYSGSSGFYGTSRLYICSFHHSIPLVTAIMNILHWQCHIHRNCVR